MYKNSMGYDVYMPDFKPGGAYQVTVLDMPYAVLISNTEEFEKPPGLDDMTNIFLEQIVSMPPAQSDDFLTGKLELGEDKIKLMGQLVAQQNYLHHQNLSSLYRDIFTLDKMKHERPFPDCYAQDQIWLKLTEDKLKIYDQVRREMREHAKSLSFIARDLVGALVDHKGQKKKADMMSGMMDLEFMPGENEGRYYL